MNEKESARGEEKRASCKGRKTGRRKTDGKVRYSPGREQVVGETYNWDRGVRCPRDSQRVGLAEELLKVEMGLAGRRYLSHTDCWKPH